MKYLFPNVICHKTFPITKMHFQMFITNSTSEHFNNKLCWDHILFLKFITIWVCLEVDFWPHFGCNLTYDTKHGLCE